MTKLISLVKCTGIKISRVHSQAQLQILISLLIGKSLRNEAMRMVAILRAWSDLTCGRVGKMMCSHRGLSVWYGTLLYNTCFRREGVRFGSY